MVQGLSVSDVVNVSWSLSQQAIGVRNFGALLICGASDVIDTTERIRSYANVTAVAADFGTMAPEYLSAALFFSQNPQPSILYIGRWAKTATAGHLYGGLHTLSAQTTLVTTLHAITDGSLVIPTDGTNRTVTGLNFSSIVTLSDAAAVIDAAWTYGTVTWDAVLGRFALTSGTTGSTSTVGYCTAAGSGTDISATCKFTTGLAFTPIVGHASETPVQCATVMAGLEGDWYGLLFADTGLTDQNHIDLANYIEAANPSRIYGLMTSATGVIDPNSTTDIAYTLSAAKYMRTFMRYSSTSPYAIASMFGRAFTVDFTANNTTITLKFKNEPGVTAELLTETQAATLDAKHVNYFVRYNNSASIIQQGVMANGYFFDEVHGADWLSNAVQTNVWNVLYTSTTKIPQTDPGVHRLATAAEQACIQGVNNGLLAPGTWTGDPIGPIKTGDTLPLGYYVYMPPVASQSQSDRDARKAPVMQIAAKLAGAVHSSNVLITVNR